MIGLPPGRVPFLQFEGYVPIGALDKLERNGFSVRAVYTGKAATRPSLYSAGDFQAVPVPDGHYLVNARLDGTDLLARLREWVELTGHQPLSAVAYEPPQWPRGAEPVDGGPLS